MQGPILGVLGCMAERLKEKLLHKQKLADLVVGPDAYRDTAIMAVEAAVRLTAGDIKPE